MGDFN
jgi:hypothetical protein